MEGTERQSEHLHLCAAAFVHTSTVGRMVTTAAAKTTNRLLMSALLYR